MLLVFLRFKKNLLSMPKWFTVFRMHFYIMFLYLNFRRYAEYSALKYDRKENFGMKKYVAPKARKVVLPAALMAEANIHL